VPRLDGWPDREDHWCTAGPPAVLDVACEGRSHSAPPGSAASSAHHRQQLGSEAVQIDLLAQPGAERLDRLGGAVAAPVASGKTARQMPTSQPRLTWLPISACVANAVTATATGTAATTSQRSCWRSTP
jgi:hypothetical protein